MGWLVSLFLGVLLWLAYYEYRKYSIAKDIQKVNKKREQKHESEVDRFRYEVYQEDRLKEKIANAPPAPPPPENVKF